VLTAIKKTAILCSITGEKNEYMLYNIFLTQIITIMLGLDLKTLYLCIVIFS